MLVLSREKNERLVIILEDGREIGIQVVRVSHGKVRLGITAPPDVKVWREELLPAAPSEVP